MVQYEFGTVTQGLLGKFFKGPNNDIKEIRPNFQVDQPILKYASHYDANVTYPSNLPYRPKDMRTLDSYIKVDIEPQEQIKIQIQVSHSNLDKRSKC